MKYFPKDQYFVGEEALLEKQRRKLAMRYHPDRGGKESDFVSMMEEYEILKSKLCVREPKPPVREPKQSETFRYEQPQRKEKRTWGDAVFFGVVDVIQKFDEILEMIPSNIRGLVLFITAMISLLSGLEILYAILVIAALLKKHWFAFFCLFFVPVNLFGTENAPEWFQLFFNGIIIFPLLAIFFIPGFVENGKYDHLTDEEKRAEAKASYKRSCEKIKEWL